MHWSFRPTGTLALYLGDTIQFTSTHPFRVKVSGRLPKSLYQCFRRRSDRGHLTRPLPWSQKTGAVVNDYTAAPVYFSEQSNGAHEWLIEFEKEPDDPETFVRELDAAPEVLNSDYEGQAAQGYCPADADRPLAAEGRLHRMAAAKGQTGRTAQGSAAQQRTNLSGRNTAVSGQSFTHSKQHI